MTDLAVAKAIVEVAVFLEFAGEELVDGDASIGALEQLAATLQTAGSSTRQELTAQFMELAAEFPAAEDFVRELPDALGIAR